MFTCTPPTHPAPPQAQPHRKTENLRNTTQGSYSSHFFDVNRQPWCPLKCWLDTHTPPPHTTQPARRRETPKSKLQAAHAAKAEHCEVATSHVGSKLHQHQGTIPSDNETHGTGQGPSLKKSKFLKPPAVSLVWESTETEPRCATNLLKFRQGHRRGTAGGL